MCASLPANMYDFSFLAPCPASGLIVHGERDTVTPTEAVTKLVNKLSQQRGITIDYRRIEGSDHFFTDHMSELDAICEAYLDKRLKPGAETPIGPAPADRRELTKDWRSARSCCARSTRAASSINAPTPAALDALATRGRSSRPMSASTAPPTACMSGISSAS